MSKLISQGGFGCVFYPGIRCNKKTQTKKKVVSKIQKNNIFSKKEIDIGALIMNIPNYEKRFVPITKSCDIDIGKITDRGIKKELKKCEVISKINKFQYVSMSMPFIEGGDLIDILKSSERNSVKISKLLSAYFELLGTLEILQSENIVHFDLKGNNILFDLNEQLPKVIDFGISIQLDKLTPENRKHTFYSFGPEYYIWPLEVHFICHLVLISDEITKEDCNNIIKSGIENNSMLSDKERIEFKERANIQFRQFIGRPKEHVYNELIKHAKTWDNYALSIIYIHILDNLFPSKDNDNLFSVKLKELLMINISPNYLERYSPVKTRELFKEIIQSKTPIPLYKKAVENMNPLKASKMLEHETKHLASIRN